MVPSAQADIDDLTDLIAPVGDSAMTALAQVNDGGAAGLLYGDGGHGGEGAAGKAP